MSIIDQNLYDELKKWCDNTEDSQLQGDVIYVNSWDHVLTKATIRKLMFELHEEDEYGELSISLYNAKSFARNMKDYYSHIAGLYFRKISGDETSVDIIKRLPPTCSWIYLLVEDVETLSDDSNKIEEVIRSLSAFSMKGANIVLIGNGDYKDVFFGCEYAIKLMTDGMTAKEDSDPIAVGYYVQERNLCRVNEVFKSEEKQRDQLCFNWEILLQQLKQNFFDYEFFKILLKETLEYITPRVTESMVYRRDLSLLAYMGAVRREAPEDVEGCEPWEFMASMKISSGLYRAIENRYGEDTFGKKIDVIVDSMKKDDESVHVSGYTCMPIAISVDNACDDIDMLSEIIHECTFEGNSSRIWRYLEKREN